MIKKTLYFGNPAYLSLKLGQLVIKMPEVERQEGIPEGMKRESRRSIPIEDVAIVILDSREITITQGVLSKLMDSGVVVISCNDRHLPNSMMLPLEGHTNQSERFKVQLEASEPLKKRLWQGTVAAKISNQKKLLLKRFPDMALACMDTWIERVGPGDTGNCEASAALYYWRHIFKDKIVDFLRGDDDTAPNNLLNYGYAILRAIVARALISSGMHPTLGIFHKNRYNAYCLADDIMEPYRPFVDRKVLEIMDKFDNYGAFTKEVKQELFLIPIIDVRIKGRLEPLLSAVTLTTASLYKCYEGENRKILYPEME